MPATCSGYGRGVGHGVGAADGVPDQHVRPVLAGRGQQGVQVRGGGHAVLGARDVVAPALPGAVVGAHPGGGADRVGDPGPGGGELAHAVEEHHRGSAGAVAVEVQPVVAHRVGLPGGRVGALDATGGDVLHGGADGRGGQDDQDRRQQPAATTGQGAAHLDEHPAGQGQHRRRPHPVEGGEGRVLRGEDQEAGTGGGHRDRGDGGPPLGLGGHPGREDAHHRPAEPEGQERGSGDDALGGAGEDDQDEDQGTSPLRRSASRR